ncbi:MAG: hypothetical protein ABEJ69_02235 [Candidatus Nanohaloarchaea archaeon]
MNVLRRILSSFIIAGIIVGLATAFFRQINFVQHTTKVLGTGLLGLIALTALSVYNEDSLTLRDKELLMNGFLVAVLLPSLYTAGAFLHESQVSWSGGEVHYHADYEVIVQNSTGVYERLELVDPAEFCGESYMCNLNDRTGVTRYHEHDDNRIHLEGVFRERSDATLRAYFNTFGGELTNEKLVYPTNNGIVKLEENANKSLKIIVRRGTGGGRHWCVVGNEIDQQYVCRSWDTGNRALSPDDYIVSPYKRGPTLDDIFIVYDSKTPRQALDDLIQDDRYQGFGIKKVGD